MKLYAWQRLSLTERIRWLRYLLPPALAAVVVSYQLGVARTLETSYGHAVHYGVEIAFYSLAGPVVTWLTLVWVERGLLEREKLEREVRARTQQLTSLTEASADAILTLDSRDLIASWNQGAQRIFGFRAAEIVGRRLEELLPEAGELRERLGRTGAVQNFETAARTRDGHSVAVDVTQTSLGEQADEAQTSLLIMRDITARRERAAILEEERARIARDLHDGVAQTLYFLALKADLSRQQLPTDADKLETELVEIGRGIRRVIREVRRTIFALRPLDWSRAGFLSALRKFVMEFAEQLGWQVSFEAEVESVPLPLRLEPTVFRLVQESLNNVAKHADASRVWVGLYRSASAELALTVRDDGGGFDPAAGNGSGLGLNQMRQRVRALGGEFRIDSRVGRGTTIYARLPL